MTTKDWTQTALVECVVDSVRELLSLGADFSPQSDLVAAGLDSLAVTQLMLAIEDRTGIWVDESRLTPENLRSAETLAACVYEQMAAA
ncbi:MAG: acyl carrier protein [Deltaproteobacteria bacterium]|nr:acyl carrier protein [Deltaproteobacteria bacterium]